MKESYSYMVWLILAALIINSLGWSPSWSLDEIPTALSMTIINVPEIPEYGVVSFIVDAKAGRISEPFHWDLLNDVPIGHKHMFSVKLDPAYVRQLELADRVVIEGYHGVGNWSRHEFSTTRASRWNVTGMQRTRNHIDSSVDMEGVVQAPYGLFWTTIDRTRVNFPSSRRHQWIPRSDGTGGYWPYKFTKSLRDTIIVSSDLPPVILGELPIEPLTSLLKKKMHSFNLVLAEEGVFTITTVESSLSDLAHEIKEDRELQYH